MPFGMALANRRRASRLRFPNKAERRFEAVQARFWKTDAGRRDAKSEIQIEPRGASGSHITRWWKTDAKRRDDDKIFHI
jgi:hypothetical protein